MHDLPNLSFYDLRCTDGVALFLMVQAPLQSEEVAMLYRALLEQPLCDAELSSSCGFLLPLQWMCTPAWPALAQTFFARMQHSVRLLQPSAVEPASTQLSSTDASTQAAHTHDTSVDQPSSGDSAVTGADAHAVGTTSNNASNSSSMSSSSDSGSSAMAAASSQQELQWLMPCAFPLFTAAMDTTNRVLGRLHLSQASEQPPLQVN